MQRNDTNLGRSRWTAGTTRHLGKSGGGQQQGAHDGDH